MSVGVAVLVLLAPAGMGAVSASAASPPAPLTMGDWQAEIGQLAAPGSGCFHAAFPVVAWEAAPCVAAPEWPLAPVSPPGIPDTVGNGVDFAASVSGLISKATGTFADVSSKISEKGKIDNSGSELPNEFTLQLNTQFFSGSPACAGSSDPSKCLGWQQFLYESNNNLVFMQYWLIYYEATCPAGWLSDSGDCYVNSVASTLSGAPLTAKSLATLSLVGSATAGGQDEVKVTTGSGKATLVTGPDSQVDLAPHWNGTEWGVFGDANGAEAFFGTGDSLEAVTKLSATSSSAPTCIKDGYTAETNNLTLAATPALGSESSPTMASKQTKGKSGTANCAVAA